MAQRSHPTEIRCIARDDLSEGGAGERAGAVRGPLPPPHHHSPNSPLRPFDDILALALGTSVGLLFIHSAGGDLIHKQASISPNPQNHVESQKLPFLRNSVWCCLALLPASKATFPKIA
ncbi:hypothetical protein ZIOFF_074153 [Zingiber officinale]|uniref:Uncharacterized protein n=1 Tax=Zingiber officinale TaxID=94328 RepID=A0A8J5C2A1_ZINOF|nr:hypothetical protein ZIOFF_074153 [Zingiber officinale]